MTTKLYKRIAALIALMMLTLTVVACGDATNTAAPAAATTAAAAATTAAVGGNVATTAASGAATTAAGAAPAAGAAVKVTGNLKLWHAYGSGGSAEGKALAKALEELKKDNPDAKVEVLDVPFDQIFKKFETEAATGGGPDLFVAPNDSLGDQARAKLLLPLDEQLKGKLENVPASVQDGVKLDGKLYGVPQSQKALAMFYNKAKVQNPPKTTDELLAAAKGGTKIGFQSSAYHNYAWWGAFGGKLFDASGKAIADQGGFAEAIQFMKDMKAAGAQFFDDGDKFGQAFQTGALDVVVEGPWKLTDFKGALKDNLGVAAIPAGPKGPAAPLAGVDAYYINAGSKNKDQAVNLALYMTSPKISAIFVNDAGQIPADKNVPVTDQYSKVFQQAVSTGAPRPQIAELSKYWENFGNAINNAVVKGADAKQVVADATKAMNTANKK